MKDQERHFNRIHGAALKRAMDRDTLSLEQIVAVTERTERSIYHWRTSEENMPVWFPRRISSEVYDAELFSDLTGAAAAGYHVTEIVKRPPGTRDLLLAVVKVGGAVGALQDEIADAVRDDSPGGAEVTRSERDAVMSAVTRAENVLRSLRAQLEADAEAEGLA